MSEIVVANQVRKVYEPDIVALDGLDLRIAEGDFVVFVGPSGCGKTTLMRMIAGFEDITGGDILFQGKTVDGPHPSRAVIFQDVRLFPWRTIKENIYIADEISRIRSRPGHDIVEDLISNFGLANYLNKYPSEVSIGVQQMVGFARVILNDPHLLLLDEPFNALDIENKEILQRKILQFWHDTGKTIVYVTHNVREAVYMGEKVAVFTARPGRVTQVVDIDLPKERWHPEVRISSEFNNAVLYIADCLKDEINRGRAQEKEDGY